jgi:hypothetical protein
MVTGHHLGPKTVTGHRLGDEILGVGRGIYALANAEDNNSALLV